MVAFREVDERVPFGQQLGQGSGGPIVFINTFRVAPEDVDSFLEAGLRQPWRHRTSGPTTA